MFSGGIAFGASGFSGAAGGVLRASGLLVGFGATSFTTEDDSAGTSGFSVDSGFSIASESLLSDAVKLFMASAMSLSSTWLESVAGSGVASEGLVSGALAASAGWGALGAGAAAGFGSAGVVAAGVAGVDWVGAVGCDVCGVAL